jgi:DNA-binding Xre family transcriptional regulator
VSTATRRLPAHGTYARANGSPGIFDGCDCKRCRPVRLSIRKRYAVNRQLGQPAQVDATPAREHLQKLHQTMGWVHLSKVSGITQATLWLIHDGDRTEIRRATLATILAIKAAPKPDPGFYIDATGSIRRVRGLMAAAHSSAAIGRAAGTSRGVIEKVMRGPDRVRQKLADKIQQACQELAGTTGTSGRARNRAALNGWAPLAAWDDIDDPNAVPQTGEETPLKRNELAALRKADVEHLAAYGIDEDEIAERVGLAKSTVHALVEEWRTGAKRDRRKQAVSA